MCSMSNAKKENIFNCVGKNILQLDKKLMPVQVQTKKLKNNFMFQIQFAKLIMTQWVMDIKISSLKWPI